MAFEIEEIDREFESYKLLFDLIRSRKPDLVEMTALASVLHSFYNGIENILYYWQREQIKATLPARSGTMNY